MIDLRASSSQEELTTPLPGRDRLQHLFETWEIVSRHVPQHAGDAHERATEQCVHSTANAHPAKPGAQYHGSKRGPFHSGPLLI